MSAALLACYVGQMRAIVEATERPDNWTTQHAKLADLALQAAERMAVAERATPALPTDTAGAIA